MPASFWKLDSASSRSENSTCAAVFALPWHIRMCQYFLQERTNPVSNNQLLQATLPCDRFQAKTTLMESIPVIMTWLGKFKRLSPKEESKVSVGWRDGRDLEEGFCVRGITDIEESIWAPKYGLKGKIDASLEAAFVDYNAEKVNPCTTSLNLCLCLYDWCIVQSWALPAPWSLLTSLCLTRGSET